MKKIPILFLLTLTVALGNLLFFSPDSSAMYQDDDNTWWSVEELLEFSQFAEREEAELCGDDFGCREELFYSRFESEDARYQALNILQEGRFWVTSVNPQAETLDILYFDEDQMLKRWGIREIQPLNFIFLAWFDRINGQVGNFNPELPVEPQFSDDLHLLYADDAISFGSESFPANIPFNLPIQSTDLVNNNLGYLYLAVFGENYNSMGYLDYSSCLQEPDHEEGTTCKLMFSSHGGYRYFPPRETILAEIEHEATIIEEITEEPEETEDTPKSEEVEGLKNDGKIEKTTNNSEPNSLTTLVKAPNTGAKSCEKVIEFPWWLGILVILGNLVFLWFFGPNFRKKFNKTLDKKPRVR